MRERVRRFVRLVLADPQSAERLTLLERRIANLECEIERLTANFAEFNGVQGYHHHGH